MDRCASCGTTLTRVTGRVTITVVDQMRVTSWSPSGPGGVIEKAREVDVCGTCVQRSMYGGRSIQLDFSEDD